MSTANFASFRSWKWIVGLAYILVALVLLVIGRTLSAIVFDTLMLVGIGIILV